MDKRLHISAKNTTDLLPNERVLHAASAGGVDSPSQGARITVGIVNRIAPQNAMCKRWDTLRQTGSGASCVRSWGAVSSVASRALRVHRLLPPLGAVQHSHFPAYRSHPRGCFTDVDLVCNDPGFRPCISHSTHTGE